MVLGSWLSFYRIEHVQLGLLDCSQKHCYQCVVWDKQWNGNEYPYLWLGNDFLHLESTGHTCRSHTFLLSCVLLTLGHSQWWSQMNGGLGFLLMFWIVAPILYCKTVDQFFLCFYWSNNIVTNVWNSAYFPISGHIAFDNTGSPYIIQNIITNNVFDPVKYAAYSPVFISITQALITGASFAALPALLIHTLCRFLL